MGDNANKNWEWHNKEIGVGYAAKGVIRQPQASLKSVNVLDMSHVANVENNQTNSKKSKKRYRESHQTQGAKIKFNPAIQLLALQLSDTTRVLRVAD